MPKGRQQREQERDRQQKDPERDRPVAPVDQQKGDAEDEAEERTRLMHLHRQQMVRSVQHLDQRHEVEEDRGQRGRSRNPCPSRTIVQRHRQHSQCGHAVEHNRYLEPENLHQWYNSGAAR